MRKILVTALLSVLLPLSASAGKMKEIWALTNESVLQTLGFEEDVVTIDEHRLVEAEGSDMAVETVVHGYVRGRGNVPMFKCVTKFAKTPEFFAVTKTDCEQL